MPDWNPFDDSQVEPGRGLFERSVLDLPTGAARVCFACSWVLFLFGLRAGGLFTLPLVLSQKLSWPASTQAVLMPVAACGFVTSSAASLLLAIAWRKGQGASFLAFPLTACFYTVCTLCGAFWR